MDAAAATRGLASEALPGADKGLDVTLPTGAEAMPELGLMLCVGVASLTRAELSNGELKGSDSRLESEEHPARRSAVTPAIAKRVAARDPFTLSKIHITQPTRTRCLWGY